MSASLRYVCFDGPGFLNGQIHFVVCSADRTEEVLLTEFSSDLWILIHRFTFTRGSSGWS